MSCSSDQHIADNLISKYQSYKSNSVSKNNGAYYKKVNSSLYGSQRDDYADEDKSSSVSCKFILSVNRNAKEVRVLISAYSNANKDRMVSWKSNIEHKWSNRVYIVDGSAKYTVVVTLYLVEDEDWNNTRKKDILDVAYNIRTITTGRSTTTCWALDDDDAPAHEVGHMLKNDDEYGVVNGKFYSEASSNIMGNASGMPEEQHYNFILEEVKKLLDEDSLYIEMK
jgi:hypothetical protein